MLFHGEPVNVGERVFHIRYGMIEVVEVHPSYFIAEGVGKRHHVTSEGMTMGMQLVFWHNPWVLIPPKNKVLWDKVVAIAQAISNIIK